MEGLQSGIDIGKSFAQKGFLAIEWVSQKIAGFIDVSSENVHLLILGGISMYLANLFSGKEMGIKFWVIFGCLFWIFKCLGF